MIAVLVLGPYKELKMATLCKCGRSPNGQCNGWHKLSHPEFLKKLREHERKTLTKEAKDRSKLSNNG